MRPTSLVTSPASSKSEYAACRGDGQEGQDAKLTLETAPSAQVCGSRIRRPMRGELRGIFLWTAGRRGQALSYFLFFLSGQEVSPGQVGSGTGKTAGTTRTRLDSLTSLTALTTLTDSDRSDPLRP